MSLLSGCEPKTQPREPVAVIGDHVTKMTAGVPYTPPKDGVWLSNEVFIRLLEKLNELQNKLDAMPQTRGRGNDDNQFPVSVQGSASREMYPPQARNVQAPPLGNPERVDSKMDWPSVCQQVP